MKNENLISFENESRELEKIFDILKANRILSEASLLGLIVLLLIQREKCFWSIR